MTTQADDTVAANAVSAQPPIFIVRAQHGEMDYFREWDVGWTSDREVATSRAMQMTIASAELSALERGHRSDFDRVTLAEESVTTGGLSDPTKRRQLRTEYYRTDAFITRQRAFAAANGERLDSARAKIGDPNWIPHDEPITYIIVVCEPL